MTWLVRRGVVIVLLLGMVMGSIHGVRAQNDQDAGGITGNSYLSPSYGYELTWSEAWTVDDEASEEGYDFLSLTNGISTVYLEGFLGFGGAAGSCVDGIRDQLADEEGGAVTVATGEDGAPLSGEEDGSAYAVYDYSSTYEDGSPVAMVAYVQCWPLPGPAAVAALTVVVPADDFNDQLDGLDDLIAGLALPPDEAALTMTDVEPFVRMVEEDLTAFWTETLAAQGVDYEAPAYITFDAPIETGCGDAAPEEIGPFYCPADRSVYLDLVDMKNSELPHGQFVVAVVIAHEVGHHIQEVLGLAGCEITACVEGERSLEMELQADCFAGAWAQDADKRGLVASGDLEQAVAATASFFGDAPNTPASDPQAHGPGALRTWWLLKGFYEGVDVCLSAEDATSG